MTAGLIICVIGLVVFLAGGLWLLVLAFAESILWGMGSLLLWPAATIGYAIVHWPRTRIPLILHFAGLLVALAGGVAWGMVKMRGFMG
jgi:hypothetical protein